MVVGPGYRNKLWGGLVPVVSEDQTAWFLSKLVSQFVYLNIFKPSTLPSTNRCVQKPSSHTSSPDPSMPRTLSG